MGEVDTEFTKRVIYQLENLQPLSDKCSIYRAPKLDRDRNEKAYTPRVVSIGPLHHGKEELKIMEEHKRRYLVDFLKWSEASLEDIIACIKKNERRLRDCYAEPIEIKGDEFVEMMLVDAAFLICFILKRGFADLRSSNDRIFYKPQMILEVRLDIILMENQVPFFILVELFELSNILEHLKGWKASLIYLTHHCFKIDRSSWVAEDILEEQDFSQVEHFLDFLIICQRPKKPPPFKEMKSLVIPTVAELRRTGIKFLHSSKNKLDIEFDKKMGILKIPHIEIIGSGQSETLLRNLVTFEKCHYIGEHKYVNDYKFMLESLVKSEKDVEILDQSGIMENWLGNNQAVPNLLGNIIGIVNRDSFYYSELVEDLNAHYKNRWHKWKANLKQNYFNTPWAGVSVAAAAFLLLLTVIQTVCSILQV